MVEREWIVGVSRGLLRADGEFRPREVGLDALDADPAIELVALRDHPAEARPQDLEGLDVLIAETVDIREASLAGVDRLALVARYGVGYDSVDLEACTRRGILVTNAPDGTQRPMATVNLALLMALSVLRFRKRLD